jgi:5-methyltetrahydrofolate--homocysteine methyltransferase
MLIIGEKINAARAAVRKTIQQRNESAIIELATAQAAAGADYIDVNGGDERPGAEAANLRWLVDVVQSHTDRPVCIDSADPSAVEAALSLARGRPIVNSVSLEAGRLEALLPLLRRADCMVVALCMSDEGPPKAVEDRLDRARRLVEILVAAGKKPADIIVDPCFFPVCSDPGQAQAVFEAIRRIRREMGETLVGGGVSNSSYGLPGRKWINLAMLTGAIIHGMNAAIVDPCQPGIIPVIRAAEVASGADPSCANYISAHRQGKLG